MIAIPTLQQEPVVLPERSFGRIVRSVLGYGLLLALMFISPLFVFVPAAVFACGVRNRRGAAVLALAIATAVAALIAMQTAHGPSSTTADALMGYAYLAALLLGVAVPALLVLPMVERGESFGRILVIALLASMAGLAATEAGAQLLTHFSPYREQVMRAHQTAEQFVVAYQKAGMPADAVGTLRRWMDIGISCLPAFFLIDVALVFVLSVVMFGRLRAWRQFMATRQPAEAPTAAFLFRNFSLPDWLLFAFVAGGLTPLATGMLQKVAANILAVVTFLYLLQGLAIFRSLLVAVGAGFMGMMFGYLLLIFLTITGIAPLLLSIAGLFDSFFDFRHFRRKDHSDESHPH